MTVRLLPHDEHWVTGARLESERICSVAQSFQRVHHIGSTSIPGIVAKPIIDLLGEVTSLLDLDGERWVLEALGYEWRGEYGLARRRYCTLGDTITGERKVQLHCYATGDPELRRHLAFRDYLRARPETAALAYQHEKQRCAALHSYDGHAYSLCKREWIDRVEAAALSTSLT